MPNSTTSSIPDFFWFLDDLSPNTRYALQSNSGPQFGTDKGDSINGSTGNDTIYGLGGDDSITGDAGNDILFGNVGIDNLDGGVGDDSLFGGKEADTLIGNSGNDLLSGNNDLDILLGGDGNDTIYGGKEGDILIGGDGDDLLRGDLGEDLLNGGAGSDIFEVNAKSLNDIAVDFTDGQDRIGLSGGLTFGQLGFIDSPASLVITLGDTPLITLLGVTAEQIDQSDFVTL